MVLNCIVNLSEMASVCIPYPLLTDGINLEFPFNEPVARSPIQMNLLSEVVPTVPECFLSTLNFCLFLTLKRN